MEDNRDIDRVRNRYKNRQKDRETESRKGIRTDRQWVYG